jgi:sulfhydrogenase subunit gamma (sulfur reductase)
MNVYQPHLMNVVAVIDETPDTRTLRLQFKDPEVAAAFAFKAGQFGEYSVFGAGESTFCMASSPTRPEFIEASFKLAGKVTNELRQLNVGDTMGFRGPYGNTFPLEQWEGKNVVFIAGGIGLAPVRCVIWNVLDLRAKFGDVTIVYGARSVADLVYKRELEEWAGRDDVKLVQTVDPGGETPGWKGEVGFVTPVVEKTSPSADNAVVVLCGPPIVVKMTLPVLAKLGFADDQVYTTLENRMKCGIGKCGRCNIGPVYVCKDGPVFTAAQLKALPAEY